MQRKTIAASRSSGVDPFAASSRQVVPLSPSSVEACVAGGSGRMTEGEATCTLSGRKPDRRLVYQNAGVEEFHGSPLLR